MKNDFIELFNRGQAPVVIDNWSLQYSSKASVSSTISSSGVHKLTGTIQPGQYFLVVEAKGSSGSVDMVSDTPAPGPLAMSGTDGKVFLVNNSTALTLSAAGCPTTPEVVVDSVGYGAANCSETAPTGVLNNVNSATRTNPCVDTDNNAADFRVAIAAPRNSTSPLNVCGGGPVSTNPSGTGLATPNSVIQGSTTLLTVKVTPGQNPDSTGITVTGDLTALVGSATQQFYDDGSNGDAVAGDGTYSFLAAVPNTVSGTLSLPVTIADLQTRTGTASITVTVSTPGTPYAIHDIQGNGDASPLNGQRVMASGIVVALASNGFYIEAPDAEQDTDPATSEGVFAYTGTGVAVGDSVDVTGKVQEYTPSGAALSTTEITTPVVAVKSHNNALPTAVEITPDPNGAIDQFERYEGMLVRLASPQVTGPTGGSSKTDGIFYTTIGTLPRPFREPGLEPGIAYPTGMPANVPHYDGNPERVKVDSSACATPATVAVGDAIPDLVGALGYTGDFTIYSCPALTSQAAAVALRDRTDKEFTVGSFNMLNFTSDPTRLGKASKAIRNIMRTPDVIGVEEVNNLTTLQALADKINADATAAGQANPNYAAQLLAPSGTQNVGFLYRTDRMTDVSIVEVGKDLLMPGSTYVVNDRPPLVMTAKVTPQPGQTFPVTIIVNHLRSLIDVDTVSSTGDFARTKRQLGAEYLAGLISSHQSAGENVISVGDYNAYEFNDGYVDVLGTVTGHPTPNDQVLLASSDLVDPDATDLAMTLPASKRYSYVENGNAQTLDHIVVTSSLLGRPYHLEIAHNNADFPGSFGADGSRSERVSDHDMPVAYFTLPDFTPHVNLSAATVAFGDSTVNVPATPTTVTVKNDGYAELTISGISLDDSVNFNQTNDCGATLAIGASCSITVGFTPTSARDFSAKVAISDNADGSPHAIALTGTGVATTMDITPASASFGDQLVGTTSAASPLTLKNSGARTLLISDVSISAGEFTQDNDCSAAIAPGNACTINVTFAPKSVGAKSATITVNDNASGTPHLIAVSGNGTQPVVSLSPASVDFGDVNISTPFGVHIPFQVILVNNTGTAPLHISGVVVNGDGFGATNGCTSEVAPGNHCTATVSFSPTTLGPKSGTITITDDAPGSPRSIPLSGNGTQSAISLSATSLNFGGQLINSSGTKTVTISNTGSGALEIFGITMTDPGNDFPMTTNCTSGLMGRVAPGATCTITVTFSPKTSGSKAGNISIQNDAGATANIALAGSGTDFTFGASSGGSNSATVSAGETATYNLEVGALSSFNGHVTFNCTGPLVLASCTVSPAAIDVTGANPAATKVVVTISTTAAKFSTAGMQSTPIGSGGLPLMFAMGGLGTLLIVAALRVPRLRVVGACATLLVAMALSSCGGHSNGNNVQTSPGTPAGTYTVVVTAVSGGTSHAFNLTLTVR